MRIPDVEMQNLYDWSQRELARIDKEHPIIRGALGGNEASKARKEHFKEYNKRLDMLKLHYSGLHTVSPAAKAQTFNELMQPKGA